jgi:nucleoside-diphosphate-sugar epimerase
MRILIIGAGGFIGSHLAREATLQGDEVVGVCRSGRIPGFVGECLKWEFGEPLPETVLRTGYIDCAMHLAHDFKGDSGAALTISSTLKCMEELRKAGVGRQIFFSSCSAGHYATSLYGRTKYALEKNLLPLPDVVIVRPGLVLGNGGIYGRICKIACLLPIIPLPDGGRGVVPVIAIDRLCVEIIALARSNSPEREVNLFEPKLRSLRLLVEDAASQAGKCPIILQIPTQWMIAVLELADRLKISLPVNTDNLRGFLANQETIRGSSIK